MRLWIDTDVGDNPDDAVALLCAAAHREVELVGVSTSAGDPGRRARAVRALVDAPVVSGEMPDELVGAFRAAAPDATLAIGPLTNIAALLEAGVPVPDLTVMGGVLRPVRHRGRLREVEHNFGSDPPAASRVVAETDGGLVPLDVTVAIRLGDRDVEAMTRTRPELEEHVERWTAAQRFARVPDDEIAVVLHDPLAFLVCSGDARVTTDDRALAVDDASGALHERADGRVHEVVIDVDARDAVARVLALLES